MNKRVRNKIRKNSILIIDVACIPAGWDMSQWLSVCTKVGIAIYDSSLLSSIAPFPIRTIPKDNIKAFRLINSSKFPEIVNKVKTEMMEKNEHEDKT